MRSCSCIFSAVGSAPSISEKSNFLFIGCYLFRPVFGFFPITLAASRAHRRAHSRSSSSSRLPQGRSLELPPPPPEGTAGVSSIPTKSAAAMSVRSRLLAVSPVVELVIEYVQRFIGNEEPAAFPVDVDMVRAGTGTIAGVLRNRCRSLCVNRNRPGCSRYRFPCGGLCRNSPCLGSRVQLFPRAFKFGRHEVAPPAEFGSLVSGVAFLQHVTAQYLLVVAQLPKLISLCSELATYSSHDQLSMDCRVSMQSRFTCPMFVSRTSAAVVQPRFRATRSAARCARRCMSWSLLIFPRSSIRQNAP